MVEDGHTQTDDRRLKTGVYRQTDRQTGRQTGRQAGRQAGRKLRIRMYTDRQTIKDGHIQTDKIEYGQMQKQRKRRLNTGIDRPTDRRLKHRHKQRQRADKTRAKIQTDGRLKTGISRDRQTD